jgi:DNA-directed RNA polymerase subunit RPC12/RpoP
VPKVKLEGYKCERCSHIWLPRKYGEQDPVICPKCKSPYWNRPRETKIRNDKPNAHLLKRLELRKN